MLCDLSLTVCHDVVSLISYSVFQTIAFFPAMIQSKLKEKRKKNEKFFSKRYTLKSAGPDDQYTLPKNGKSGG